MSSKVIHHLYICSATKWLKSSVQIQMSNLFVFVCREPFLSGTARSICETQSEELFICLGCSPAHLCSCPSLQPSFASAHCAVMDRWRPLTAASMHGSRALSCRGPKPKYTSERRHCVQLAKLD